LKIIYFVIGIINEISKKKKMKLGGLVVRHMPASHIVNGSTKTINNLATPMSRGV